MKRLSLGSSVRMMGTSCISLRLRLKEEASACGNARNVTRTALTKRPLEGSKKRWERDLRVSLPCQFIRNRGLLQLVVPCPQIRPAGQFQTDSKAALRHALAVDDPR